MASIQYLNTSAGNSPDPLPEHLYHIDTPTEHYDLNFVLPVKPLESEGVRLEPLIPSVHAAKLHALLVSSDPTFSLYRYLPYPACRTLPSFLTFLETMHRDPNTVLFVITDLSRPEVEGKPESRWAGWIGLIKASARELCAEVGHVSVLPRAWRTHVNTHASSLLIQYLLEPVPQGLALHRVDWCAHSLNQPSNNAAKRLGFHLGGTLHWARVLNFDKEGFGVEDKNGLGSAEQGLGRHTNNWEMTWEDWRAGAGETVRKLMERPVEKNVAWE